MCSFVCFSFSKQGFRSAEGEAFRWMRRCACALWVQDLVRLLGSVLRTWSMKAGSMSRVFEGIKFYCICHGVRCKRMADFPDWLARGRGALGAEPAVAPALIISRRVEVHRTAAAIFTIFRVIKTRVCGCQSAH